MHASHTSVGHRYDVNMMAIIVYISYQSIMEKLGATSNTLKYMMDTTALDATQVAEHFAYMPLDYQPHEWLDRMTSLQSQYPKDYGKTFAVYWFLPLALCFEWDTAVWLMD